MRYFLLQTRDRLLHHLASCFHNNMSAIPVNQATSISRGNQFNSPMQEALHKQQQRHRFSNLSGGVVTFREAAMGPLQVRLGALTLGSDSNCRPNDAEIALHTSHVAKAKDSQPKVLVEVSLTNGPKSALGRPRWRSASPSHNNIAPTQPVRASLVTHQNLALDGCSNLQAK